MSDIEESSDKIADSQSADQAQANEPTLAVTLNVDSDKMAAYLSLPPCRDRHPFSGEDISQKLTENGITSGIDQEALQRVVDLQTADNTLIAIGTPAVDGEDGHFKVLLPEPEEKAPFIDDNGIAHYFELQDFVLVNPGDPLMRRKPATLGKPGKTVYGEIIEANPGKEEQFCTHLEGAGISEDDENLLIATQKGSPEVLENGVNVHPALKLKKVDLSTGNITFDGCIYVDTDVEPGLKINATDGDVIINGSVQAAEITASGNIILNGGILGTINKNPLDANAPIGSILTAGGHLEAVFADHAILQAKKNVSIKEYAYHCKIRADECIKVGESGGKGAIIGGNIRATYNVSANTVGSLADVPTSIEVGIPPDVREQYNEILETLNEHREALDERCKSLTYTKQQLTDPITGNLAENAKSKMMPIIKQISQIKEKIHHWIDLEQKIITKMGNASPNCIISQKMYGNVSLTLNDKTFNNANEAAGGTFLLKDSSITRA